MTCLCQRCKRAESVSLVYTSNRRSRRFRRRRRQPEIRSSGNRQAFARSTASRSGEKEKNGPLNSPDRRQNNQIAQKEVEVWSGWRPVMDLGTCNASRLGTSPVLLVSGCRSLRGAGCNCHSTSTKSLNFAESFWDILTPTVLRVKNSITPERFELIGAVTSPAKPETLTGHRTTAY